MGWVLAIIAPILPIAMPIYFIIDIFETIGDFFTNLFNF